MEEREIDLKDLAVKVLLHWRGVIIMMLIGALLMGGYSYMKTGKEEKAQIAAREAQASGAEGAPAEPVEVIPAHVEVKDVLMGAVLFAFLYAGIFAVAYILDNKIKLCDNLEKLYQIPQLGKIPEAGSGKKKLFSFVDRRIRAFGNRGMRKLTGEEAVNLAAVSVRLIAQANNLTSLSLIGCNMTEDTLADCKRLEQLLDQEGIAVTVLNNVLYEETAMEQLGWVEAAVLVERAGATFYSEIDQELALLYRQNILVLGGIVKG